MYVGLLYTGYLVTPPRDAGIMNTSVEIEMDGCSGLQSKVKFFICFCEKFKNEHWVNT
jgi:hypothetical protein